ncbi:16229_t:CDS:2 [Acaulospora colombiana]|uniref:16229_t:CDS:1 n=1 Tax=Acaulospora colombiana TaxID=27376 RepID=A0ACA9LSG2_9GLOM|nr:16229_t:CDS:2 [Acaulospora colombiana]
MVPSLQNNEPSSDRDNTAKVQTSLNQVYSTLIDEHQTHSDVSPRVPYSSKVSSPLKLSYIPDSVSGTEDNTQLEIIENNVTNDTNVESNVTSDTNIEKVDLELPSEKPVELNENFLEVESIEFLKFTTDERQQENLLDPVNHLKELLQDQSSELDNIRDVQNHSHSFDTSSEIPSTSTDTDVEHQISDVSDIPSSQLDTINPMLRKTRVPPVALISADIRQVRSCVQRTNAYGTADVVELKYLSFIRNSFGDLFTAKLELLKQEETGLHLWLNLNREKEPPLPVKNYRKKNKISPTLASAAANKIYSNPTLATSTSSQPALSTPETIIDSSADINTPNSPNSLNSSKSSKSSISLRTSLDTNRSKSRQSSPPMSPKLKSSNFFSSKSRHGNSIKSNRSTVHMPPPVMNDPAVNSSVNSKSLKSSRQRRFSFQAVSSRFSFSSNSPSPTVSTTIEEKSNSDSSSSVVVDETALNRLCDVLPHEDRDVLAGYLRAAGGKDDLMAVGLYMKDLKGGNTL